jgi:hypothetical protein
MTVAVVQKHKVGLAIVSHHDVEVAVPIQVGHRHGVGRRVLDIQRVCPPKDAVTGVEKDEVLLGPVTPICDDRIQISVGVHVAEPKRSRKVLGDA